MQCKRLLNERVNQEQVFVPSYYPPPKGFLYAGDEPLNEEVLATLESVWAPASKQIPALGMEKVHQVTAIYDHGTLIHTYQAPVVCV
jgi:hypothetical protein